MSDEFDPPMDPATHRWVAGLVAENERLRAVLGEILNEHYWVDAHPGEPCKRLLNAIRLSTWERWRAVLSASKEPTNGR